MEFGDAVIFDELESLPMERSRPVIYDRDIELRLLYQDLESGEEHYLIRYPAGLKPGCTAIRRPTRSSSWRGG